MIYINNSKLNTLLIGSVIVTLLVGCASSGSSQNSGTPPSAAAAAPELPAPKKIILVFDADANQAYEILGEVDTTLTDQRIYNVDGSMDQAREHLKRVAYAKYGDQLDAIINYRTIKTVGGGGYWGQIGAAYGAKNTDVRTNGVAIHFTGKSAPQYGGGAQSPVTSNTKKTTSAPVPPKSEPSSQKMTVQEIQQHLSELGYHPGPADGKMGKSTIEALKKFQHDNNLAKTGQANNETIAKLFQK
ncbi:MAG: peptidoglycan-binding domain-containing protein [Sulfuricella sp.]